MQKWEYCTARIAIDPPRVIYYKPSGEVLVESIKIKGKNIDDLAGMTIARLGLEGWEAFAASGEWRDRPELIHFKRPLP